MTRGTMIQTSDDSLIVNVPLRLKKRGGRTEVILQHAFNAATATRMPQQEALVIALARAYRWQKLLDEGKFNSVSDLARSLGLDVSFAARLMRLTLLAPDIVEMILMGEEPSGLSLRTLTKQLPVVWEEQRKVTETTQV